VANRIRKGDTVQVISGNDLGLQGTVQRVLPRKDRVVVSGVNVVKKHQRPVRAGRGEVQAGVIEFEAPVHLSNVMLVCPQCNEPTRVGFTQQEEDSRKVRVCRACGEVID
jgi:large subunit ribosomal protein L24